MRRIISKLITAPEEKAMVQGYIEKMTASQAKIAQLTIELEKDSARIIQELGLRHGINPEIQLYIDADRFKEHGLLFLESVAFLPEEEAPAQPAKVVH